MELVLSYFKKNHSRTTEETDLLKNVTLKHFLKTVTQHLKRSLRIKQQQESVSIATLQIQVHIPLEPPNSSAICKAWSISSALLSHLLSCVRRSRRDIILLLGETVPVFMRVHFAFLEALSHAWHSVNNMQIIDDWMKKEFGCLTFHDSQKLYQQSER